MNLTEILLLCTIVTLFLGLWPIAIGILIAYVAIKISNLINNRAKTEKL